MPVASGRSIEWRYGGDPADAEAWYRSPAQLHIYVDIRLPDTAPGEWYRTWAVTRSWVEANVLAADSAIVPPLLVVADGSAVEIRERLDGIIQTGWELIIRSATHLEADHQEVEW